MRKIIRITRHPVDDARLDALRQAFGSDIDVKDDDVSYGDDPVKTVQGLIQKHGGNVIALEVVAPIATLAKLTQAKRELGGIVLLRAEFARCDDGRPKVTGQDANGRDVFAFDHYDVIERVEVVARRLS